MLRLRALAVLALFFASSIHLIAQAPGTGLYTFGSFDNRGFDSINIGNLNTHFEIPIVTKSGRGVPFKYTIVYDGLIWSAAGSSGSEYWVPDSGWGFHGQVNDGFAGHLNYHTQTYKCFSDPPSWYWSTRTSNYNYYDAFGQQHNFNYATDACLGTTTGDGTTSDGSGYSFDGNTIHNHYGAVIQVPQNNVSGAGSITDTNGNVVNNNGNGTFTDTLGVTALTIGGGGNASSARTFTYNVANQSDRSTSAFVTMSYRTYTIQTNFGCSDGSGSISEYGPLQNDLVDRITLPDGSFYQFNYEPTPGVSGAVTGRLASITLPTGGIIQYQYLGGCNGNGMNADGTIGSLNRVTTDGTRYFGRSPSPNGSVTTLQDEVGNQTRYTFTNVNGVFYETHRQVYQGNGGSGTPLLDQQTCYGGATPSCDGSAITSPILQVDTWSSLNGGAQRHTRNLYDNVTFQLASVLNYDFDGTTLLKNTTNVYITNGRINSSSVSDGVGHVISSVNYGYDENTPISTSGIPQHGPALTHPGNQTSAHVAILPGGTTLDTTSTYYDTGVPISSTGPTGTTQYSYESTQGFATQVTPPTPSSGVSLPSYASYDANSGIQLWASDANNGSGTPQLQYAQYDKLLRPTQINTVDGGQTTYAYYPAGPTWQSSVSMTTALGQNGNANTSVLYDGYGRSERTAVANGQGTNPAYQVDYCYDAVGNLHFQSTRYQGNGWSTPKQCSGSGTTYSYDALGRVTNINTADGNTTYQYNGRAVKTTDVNGVQKITQTDALGRISRVCEVFSITQPNGDTPQDCQLDIAGSGYLTQYAYDLANRQTTITQGAQTRIFLTDSLGRTTYTKEPESGETNYSYTYNSTGLQVTRTRPQANQCTNINCLTTTTTQYDALGRPLSVTYNDGTPNKQFFYDSPNQSMQWSSTPGNTKGRLVDMTSGSGSTLTRGRFDYDAMGRITHMWQCAPSICGTSSQESRPGLQFGYDLGGNLTYEFDGASGGIQYARSLAGEVTAITNLSYTTGGNPPNLVSNIVNGPSGPITYDLGNGTSSQLWYDSMGRFSMQVFCVTSAKSDCYSNQFYGVWTVPKGSRIIHTSDDVLGGGADYGYDEFNRLTSMNGPSQSFTYDYDRYGNRLHQDIVSGSGTTPGNSFDTSTNQITTSGYVYDAAGNLKTDGLTHYSYSYDAEGNVTALSDGTTTAQYVYDALNRRVRVQTSSSTYEYLFDYTGHRTSSWLEPDNAGNEGRIYWDGKQIAYRAWNGNTYFEHQDGLGTERMRTDYTPAVSSTYQSLPWGDGYTTNENDLAGNAQDNLHFAQLDLDADGTHHAQFRQYSSTQGRWMSPDPYSGSYDSSDPQSFNRYAYARNNPLAVIDPSGLSGVCVSAFPYGNAEEPYVDPSIYNSADCASAYGTWVETGSDVTMDVSSTDPVADPGNGAYATPPSSSNSSGTGGGTGVGSGAAPSNAAQTPTQCKSNFYKTGVGKVIAFLSPLSTIPGSNDEWKTNLAEWTLLPAAKGAAFWAAKSASSATGSFEVLSVTSANSFPLAAPTEAGIGFASKRLGKLASYAIGAATAIDALQSAACGLGTISPDASTAIGLAGGFATN